jgi:shikimate dehydrogenase
MSFEEYSVAELTTIGRCNTWYPRFWLSYLCNHLSKNDCSLFSLHFPQTIEGKFRVKHEISNMMIKTINGSTTILAVFGDPVAHSLSPMMHNAAFEFLDMNCIYVALHVRPEELPNAVKGVRALNIKGGNFTIPHKQAVLPELDEIFGDSLLSGSVNTLINRNGKLYGTSTDGIGLIRSLREDGEFEPAGKNILLLGAGGSAAAVIYRLVKERIKSLRLVNRDFSRAVALQQRVTRDTGFEIKVEPLHNINGLDWDSIDLLINTTSVGLHTDETLVPAEFLKPPLFVCDIIYKKTGTRLLNEAAASGCKVLSGLSMLLFQGAESFSLWFETNPPIDIMRKALKSF